MTDHEARVTDFIERFGHALGDGDLDTIVAAWGIPAFVVSNEGVRPVENASEVRAFFEAAIESYREQGYASARPVIQKLEILADSVVSVDVRWENLDHDGVEQGREHSRYVLREPEPGTVRIHVAITTQGPEADVEA